MGIQLFNSPHQCNLGLWIIIDFIPYPGPETGDWSCPSWKTTARDLRDSAGPCVTRILSALWGSRVLKKQGTCILEEERGAVNKFGWVHSGCMMWESLASVKIHLWCLLTLILALQKSSTGYMFSWVSSTTWVQYILRDKVLRRTYFMDYGLS